MMLAAYLITLVVGCTERIQRKPSRCIGVD
jgi:hypothetical protein